MITYIIVDDEPLAHEILEEFCKVLPHLELKRNCYNALEAMQFLNTEQVDLIFLDINMPRLTGFEFLKTLSNPPKIIVTTAYKEFALEGYELNIIDYLLKPYSFERLVKAINKAIINPSKKQNNDLIEHKPYRFFVKGDKKYHQVDANDILFVEAYGNYTKLHLQDEIILTHETISHYEEILSVNFLRVHKSFIIAIDKIKQIEGNRIIISKHVVPIGRTYKSVVGKLYNS